MHGRQLTVEVGYRRQGGDARVRLREEPRQGGGHGGRGEGEVSWESGGSKELLGEGGERCASCTDERRSGRSVESHCRPADKRRRGQWMDDAMIIL